MATPSDFEPDDLRRVLEAFLVVTVALEDDGAGLGRHVTLLRGRAPHLGAGRRHVASLM